MVTTKQPNIKSRTYYYWNDLINIKYFDPRLLKLDKKSLNNTKKPEYSINSVNPQYLLIDEIDGFIEEKKGHKYLNIALTDRYNEVLKKYADVWRVIKDQIKKINDGKLGEYGKDYMKIKFNSDDNLPLNKALKSRILTIIIKTIFEEDGKYYPEIYLDDCFYEI